MRLSSQACILAVTISALGWATGRADDLFPEKPAIDVATLVSDQSFIDLSDEASPEELFKKVTAYRIQQDNEHPPSGMPFNLSGSFTFPQNAKFDDGKPRENSLFGIDVSHYTDKSLDFSVLKRQGVQFVYLKATQGTGYKDPTFAFFWDQATSSGLLSGAYHFLSSKSPGKDQGESFVKFIRLHGGFSDTNLPPVMDLEWDVTKRNGPDHWIGTSPAEIIDKALECLAAIEQGMQNDGSMQLPIIYTSKAWIAERDIPQSEFDRLSKYPIWIADYSQSHRAVEKPAEIYGRENLFWQFTSNARLQQGYSGGLDANIYYGSIDEFYTEFKIEKK